MTYCAAIQDDSAGTAVARIAADMCAGEPEVFANEMDQQQSGLDFSGMLNSITFTLMPIFAIA